MVDYFIQAVADFENEVFKLREIITRAEGERGKMLTLLQTTLSELENYNKDHIIYIKTGELLRSMSDEVSQKLFERLELIITKGYDAIFKEDAKFVIKSDVKYDAIHLSFWIDLPNGKRVPLIGYQGGGVVVLTAMMLQIVYVYLLRNIIRPFVCADEPLAQLSKEFRQPAAKFLSYLSNNLKVQVLMVTHELEHAEFADVAYRFNITKLGGTTTVERIK